MEMRSFVTLCIWYSRCLTLVDYSMCNLEYNCNTKLLNCPNKQALNLSAPKVSYYCKYFLHQNFRTLAGQNILYTCYIHTEDSNTNVKW